MNKVSEDEFVEKAKDTDQTKLLEKIRNSALYSLTRRDHSYLELKQKLLNKGHDSNNIDQVLHRLKETNLLDDMRFAENYTTYRRNRGYGPVRVSMELKNKGVNETIIAQVVQMADNAWFTEARKVWQKQQRKHQQDQPLDHKEKARQMRFLYNRGFTQEQINRVMKHNDEEYE